MMPELREDEPSTPFRPVAYLGVGVVIAWALSFVIIYFAIPDWERRAQLGDLFGAVNSLFSGLAFAGVIYTIYLQKEELSLQRKELQLTRDELRRTATAQEKSERALQKQVEALELTARLNALAMMIEHSQVLIERSPVARDRALAETKQREYVEKLRILVNDIEDSHLRK